MLLRGLDMALTKYKLGELIQHGFEKNNSGLFSLKDVRGISINKIFIETKADMESVSLTPYIIVKPDFFAFVPITSRNGEKITLAYNDTEETYIVSSSYEAFHIIRKDLLNSKYLFMFFNRSEFDRYARFNSWGSAREAFSWEDLCNMEVTLPDIKTQQKYVDVYNAMVANQKCYERGLDDLKLVCDAYLEKLKKDVPGKKIGDFLSVTDKRNVANLTKSHVRGLSTNKEIIDTKANLDGVSLSNYKLFCPGQIAYVSDTSRRGDKISLAYNDSKDTFLVSSISTVFDTDKKNLLPEYLTLFLTRGEFDRYARFHSWGSARETFEWEEMCDVKIPLPDIEVQKSISDIHKVYIERKKINEKLKEQIKKMCPILIKGSLEDRG